MKIEEHLNKDRSDITLSDIIVAFETYDWEFIDAKDAMELYVEISNRHFLLWLDEGIRIAILDANDPGHGTLAKGACGLVLETLKEVKEKYLSLKKQTP